MKTFLLDLHGGLADFGPAGPLLYPLREGGELHILGRRGSVAAGRDITALADAVRIELMREFRANWLALFMVELAGGAGGPKGLAEQLDEIRGQFLERLASFGLSPGRALIVAVDAVAREPHTGAPLDPGAREHWQGDLNRLAENPRDALGDVTVIRFPLRRSPEPIFHRDLIHVVYLLLAIIEALRSGNDPPRGRLYQVREVALDSQEVTRWMDEYIACLQDAERAVAQRLENANGASLQLIHDPQCQSGQALPMLELSQQSFGWFRQQDDLSRWNGWGQRIGSALDARARAGDEVLQRCVDDRRTREFKPVTEKVSSLEQESKRLRERLDTARRALIDEPPSAHERWDWSDEMRRRTPGAWGRIEARPRPRAFVISLAALLLLLLAPALMTVPGTGLSRLLPTAMLLLAGSLVAAITALHRLRADLMQAVDAAVKSARWVGARLGEHVERQLRHLERLCEAEAARYNDNRAREALVEHGREVVLMRYHRDALRHHLQLAAALRRFHGADPGARSPAAAMDGEVAHLSFGDWPVEQPLHRHPIYAPARCAGTGIEASPELRIGQRQVPLSSALARGLQHVQLEKDPIYEPQASLNEPEHPPANGG